MSSTHGPETGLRSRIEAQRTRARLLEVEGHNGVRASADTVARLAAAKALLDLSGQPAITLDLGAGPASYAASDITVLLALCGEAFARHDAAG